MRQKRKAPLRDRALALFRGDCLVNASEVWFHTRCQGWQARRVLEELERDGLICRYGRGEFRLTKALCNQLHNTGV